MNKEEFIGKLEMIYVGDRNAIDEIVEDNQKLKNEVVYSKVEIDRLNNIIKKLIYECWGSDMSYGEFEGVWQIAFDEKYEPDKIKKLEEELKENK